MFHALNTLLQKMQSLACQSFELRCETLTLCEAAAIFAKLNSIRRLIQDINKIVYQSTDNVANIVSRS